MHTNYSRGFTIWELLAVLAVVVLLSAIVLPLLSQPRINSKSISSQSNLRVFNTSAANHAESHQGQIFAITQDRQIESVLRGATNRYESQDLNVPDSTLLHLRYSHIVLLDYFTDRQPEPIMASPFDNNLIEWQYNPLGYLDEDSDFPYGGGMPSVVGYDMDPMWLEESVKQLWPFGSSYQVVPHAWVDDIDPQYTPSADSPHHMIKGDSDEPLGGRKMSEVAFPSAKVFMYEEFDRLSDPKGIYAAYPEAKINLAFFDGSVRSELVSKANSAFDADHPDRVWEQRYVPLDTFPAPMSGLGESDAWDLRFRWTKDGLAGVDYK